MSGPDAAVMSLALTAARIAACLMVAPGFSSPRLSVRARLFVALAASLLIEPLARERLAGDAAATLAVQALALARETLIGAGLGMVARVYLVAFEMATSMASTFMGLSAAFAPTAGGDDPAPTLSAAFDLAALMLVFAAGLDAAMIRALAGSYASFGASFGAMPEVGAGGWLAVLIDSLRDATLIGLQIAAPILTLSIVTNVSLGVVSRFMPQVQIYFVASPLMILLGLGALYTLERPIFGLLVDALERRIASL